MNSLSSRWITLSHCIIYWNRPRSLIQKILFTILKQLWHKPIYNISEWLPLPKVIIPEYQEIEQKCHKMQDKRPAKYQESLFEDVAIRQVIFKTICWKQIIIYSNLTGRAMASKLMEMQYSMAFIFWLLPLLSLIKFHA